ncbi:MAG: phosphate acyltransferase PlsX [Thiotrichales bacterium]
MSKLIKISLDAMGGDFGPEVIVPAALEALKRFDDIELVLVGQRDVLEARLRSLVGQASAERLSIQHASEVVEMDELPSQALRGKKDSSMRVAINLVKAGHVDAAVSAGNTGALMATAKFVLKTLPGVSRPAIATGVPSMGGHTHLLDLGANIDSSAEQLYQFAVMGAALAEAVDNNPAPKIGLLNIGSEEIKGSAEIKEASKLLADSELNYSGFVEGDDIYSGTVDVIVCDGFVGNVALKTSEGLAKMISHKIKNQFKSSLYSKFAALVSMPVLKAFRKEIDPRNYNGASLLGLTGVVVKSHGGADEVAFGNAIKIARLEAMKNIPQRISGQLEKLLAA